MIGKMILGKNVAVAEDHANHVTKHGFNFTIDDIVNLADRVTNDNEGLHISYLNGKLITIVVSGTYKSGGRTYGIVRTILDFEGRPNKKYDLPVSYDANLICERCISIPYTHGYCRC